MADFQLDFQTYWIEPILTGKKTATMRRWSKPEVEAGGVYEAITNDQPPPKVFARLHVTGVRNLAVDDITDELANRDAPGASAEQVKKFWGTRVPSTGKPLWFVEFEVSK
jgi:hypothetical protein